MRAKYPCRLHCYCSLPALNTSIEDRCSIQIIRGVYSPIGNAFIGGVYVYNADYLCNWRIGNTSLEGAEIAVAGPLENRENSGNFKCSGQ